MAVAHGEELAGHGHAHGGPVHTQPRSPWTHGSWVRAIWVSILFVLIADGIAAFIRHLLGFSAVKGANAHEVLVTFGLTFWAIGFTVGIGCFDYWWGYLIGSKTWEA